VNFSGNIKDGQLQVGKFVITLPNKTVLQTIEGTFNVALQPTGPASVENLNTEHELEVQTEETKTESAPKVQEVEQT